MMEGVVDSMKISLRMMREITNGVDSKAIDDMMQDIKEYDADLEEIGNILSEPLRESISLEEDEEILDNIELEDLMPRVPNTVIEEKPLIEIESDKYALQSYRVISFHISLQSQAREETFRRSPYRFLHRSIHSGPL